MSWKVINPADESVFCTVRPTSDAELEDVVERMRVAQREWRDSSMAERVAACREFVDAFRAMKETVALDLTRQMGKPLVQARREVDTMLDRAETMIRLAPAALQDEMLEPRDRFRRFIRHEPLGIVLDIPAWNYPLLIAVNVVVPAILAGNAVLLKHARLTPRCGDAFAEAFGRTSLPILSRSQVRWRAVERSTARPRRSCSTWGSNWAARIRRWYARTRTFNLRWRTW
jgi:acyl-CoA reductase-like NAD-dependent aldehyde dehydrogenase